MNANDCDTDTWYYLQKFNFPLVLFVIWEIIIKKEVQRISIIGKFKQMVNKQYDYIFKYMIKVKVVKDLIKIIFF